MTTATITIPSRRPAQRLTTAIVDDTHARTIIRASGNLDIYTASDFREAVDTRIGDCDVLLDLIGVTFIDAAGVGALMSIANRLGRRGCRVALLCGEAIAGAVRVSGIDAAVTVAVRM